MNIFVELTHFVTLILIEIFQNQLIANCPTKQAFK